MATTTTTHQTGGEEGGDSSTSLLREMYTNSLAPLASVVSLGELLSDEQYITADTVDRLVQLEEEKGIGLNEAKKLLVTSLMSLGPAKVGEIKRLVREFVKSKKDVIGTLDVKVPPSMMMSSEGGVVNGRTEVSIKKNKMTAEMETFSILFHTFLHKFITSYENSSTLQKRLPWVMVDTSLRNLSKYFNTKILSGGGASKSHVTVSIATLLEGFKQLRVSACVEGGEGERRREGDGELGELMKLIAQKDFEIKEMLQVNGQWMLECQDLKEKMATLENNEMKQEELSPSSPPLSISGGQGDTGEEEEESEINCRYTEALERIEELERQLNESIRRVDYDVILEEKRENSSTIIQLTEEIEGLREQVREVQSQSVLLRESNDSLLVDGKRLREEKEEDKNYIEELRDQVSNLRLNLKSKEPSVREMSILLETNRRLREELTDLKTTHKQDTSSDLYQPLEREMREERDIMEREKREERERLEKENHQLQKSLETVKDELLAVRTYLKDLEKHKSSRSHEMIVPNHTPRTTPIPRPRDPSDNGVGHLMSFSSQQRQCPMCSRVYHELNDKDFQLHVARCFQ